MDDTDVICGGDRVSGGEGFEGRVVLPITQRVPIRQTWWTEDWRDEAACKPPPHLRKVFDDAADERARQAELAEWVNRYFPTRHETADQVAQMKEACRSCPVQAECLDWALRAGEWHGVWGGLTADERRDLWREQEGRPMGARARKRAERGVLLAEVVAA